MALHRFTRAEMVSVTGPWVTPGHAERLVLDTLLSAGVIRFTEAAHGDVLGTMNADEAERVSGLSSDLGATNELHDDLARIIWHSLRAHEIVRRREPTGRATTELRTWLFPDELRIVSASYRESAGRAMARASQLTPEREALLTTIPVQDSNLFALVTEWNLAGAQMGALHDERATPTPTAAERTRPRAARTRWLRAVKTVLNALEIEAETSLDARRILERIATIEAAVARRLSAGNGASDDDELDDDPEGDPEGDPGETTPAS